MEISSRAVRGVMVMEIVGKVVGEESLVLKRYLDELLANVPEDVPPLLVLNIKEMPFLDSAGLGAVVAAQQQVAKRGGRMALAHVVPHIQRILTVARLSPVLPVYADEETAVAVLVEGAIKRVSLEKPAP